GRDSELGLRDAQRAGESVPGVLGGDHGGDDGLRGDAGAGGDGTAAVRGGDVEAVSDDGAGGGGVDHHWVEGAVWGAVGFGVDLLGDHFGVCGDYSGAAGEDDSGITERSGSPR